MLMKIKAIMRHPKKQALIEWGFIVVLAVLCAVLTVMQYRWTGEISRAESERLLSNLTTQSSRICEDFDRLLRDYSAQIVPPDGPLAPGKKQLTSEAAILQWTKERHLPIFSRIGLVSIGTNDNLDVRVFDGTTGKITENKWPDNWLQMKSQISLHDLRSGAPPIEDPTGVLLEFSRSQRPRPSSFGDHGGPGGPGGPPEMKGGNFQGDRPPPEGGPGPNDHNPMSVDLPKEGGWPGGLENEREWVILELNLEYLRRSWFANLERTYLNFENQSIYYVTVKTTQVLPTVIYSSSGEDASDTVTDVKPVTIRFNYQGRASSDRKMGERGPRWVLSVYPRPGSLESMVASSRWKNLAVSVGLDVLIFFAGCALVRYTRRSRELAEAQMDFVAGVSHELRTPLTVIHGAGHNLLHGVVKEQSQIEQYARLIVQHSSQLSEMVEQILAFAEARKKTEVTHVPVSIENVVREAVAATASEVRESNCTVELNLPSQQLPQVLGDSAALRRVFQNLISNAVKYAASGMWIGITASEDRSGRHPMIVVRVADHGPGIPENEKKFLFTAFFRGEASRKRSIRGCGLGLSLAKEIVDSHQGFIHVENQISGGAVFTVCLPAIKTEGQH